MAEESVVPGIYACHVVPPSIVLWYTSTGSTPPDPPVNVADTSPPVHMVVTFGSFVIFWDTGCATTFHVTTFQSESVQPVPEEVLRVRICILFVPVDEEEIEVPGV